MSQHWGGSVVFFSYDCAKVRHFALADINFLPRWQLKGRSNTNHKTQITKHKTHNTQHTTHNNQHELPPPYPSVALLSPSMSRPDALRNHDTASPHGSMQGEHQLIWRSRAQFPCLGHEMTKHEKQRDGHFHGLWWQPLNQTTQQPTDNRVSALAVG